MSLSLIFWTQVGSILSFVVALFVLYRLLVDQKDATIQLLKESASSLKDQLAEAKTKTPDVLAKSLSDRVKLLEAELLRMSQDQTTSKEEFKQKELEIRVAKQRGDDLSKQIARAQAVLDDFLCPQCHAPMLRREYRSELVEHNGRELDIEHEFVEFECGYSAVDGKAESQCKSKF